MAVNSMIGEHHRVITTDGVIPITDLKGTEKLYDMYGETKGNFTIINHGLQNIYRVVFTDKSTIDCGYYNQMYLTRHALNYKFRNECIGELYDKFGEKPVGQKLIGVLHAALTKDFKKLPFPPYIMGRIIADKYISKTNPMFYFEDKRIYQEVLRENPDFKFIPDFFSSKAMKIKHLPSGLYGDKLIKLIYKGSNKHMYIPNLYMDNDSWVGIDLITGIFDAIGQFDGSNYQAIVTRKKNVDFLVQIKELALNCGIQSRIMKTGKLNYQIRLFTNLPLFKEEKFISSFKNIKINKHKTYYKSINKIIKLDEKQNCYELKWYGNSDQSYITGNHNLNGYC